MTWFLAMIRKIDRDTKKSQGSMLILVLVIIVFLAALVFRSQSLASARLSGSATDLDLVRLRTVMTDGILQGMNRLKVDQTLTLDDPSESWNEPFNIEDPSGASTRVRIRELSGRFDLNNVYVEVPDITIKPIKEFMLNLFTECGDFSPSERIEALTDWVDNDDNGFYEVAHYQEREPYYAPANFWLNSWSELLHVEGFDREYLRRHTLSPNSAFKANFQDVFVIIPGARMRPTPVNINFAPRAVLLGLLGQEELSTVESIIAYRKERPILDLDLFLLRLEDDKANTLRQYFTTASTHFRIDAGGYYNGISARTSALVKRGANGKVRVLKWVL